jgi:hypothetical protein
MHHPIPSVLVLVLVIVTPTVATGQLTPKPVTLVMDVVTLVPVLVLLYVGCDHWLLFLLLALRVVSLWFLLQPLLVLVFGVLACGYAALIKLLVPRTLAHTTVLLLLAAALDPFTAHPHIPSSASVPCHMSWVI